MARKGLNQIKKNLRVFCEKKKKNSLLIHYYLVNLRFFPMGFLCVLKTYHVRLYTVGKMGFGMAPKWCGIHPNLNHYYRKISFFYISKTLAACARMCLHMLWPTYAGHCPRTWAKGHFRHFISKNRFLLI